MVFEWSVKSVGFHTPALAWHVQLQIKFRKYSNTYDAACATSQLTETSLTSCSRWDSLGDKSSPPHASFDPGTDLTSAGIFAPHLSKKRVNWKRLENLSERKKEDENKCIFYINTNFRKLFIHILE